MVVHGFITPREYRAAKATRVTLRSVSPDGRIKAPYFTDAVRRYIVRKYGEDRLYTDGLKVYTTVDLALQQKATKALIQGARAWERPSGPP